MSDAQQLVLAVRQWLSQEVDKALAAGGALDPEDVMRRLFAVFPAVGAQAADPGHWAWVELRSAFELFAAATQRAAQIAPELFGPEGVRDDDVPFAVSCPTCSRTTIVQAFEAFGHREWGRWVREENDRMPFWLDAATFQNRVPVAAFDCAGCGDQIRICLAVFVAPQGETVGRAPVAQPAVEVPDELGARRTLRVDPQDAGSQDGPSDGDSG